MKFLFFSTIIFSLNFLKVSEDFIDAIHGINKNQPIKVEITDQLLERKVSKEE